MTRLVVAHLLLSFVIVTAVWSWQLRTKNAGIVDSAWAFIIGLGGVIHAGFGSGDAVMRALAGGMAALWALRLGGYLAIRNGGKPEERRYAELRREWGAHANARMLAFFWLQAVIAWAIALTLVPICARSDRPWIGFAVLGALLGLAGVVGESLADRQLYRFKRDPANRGRVMDRGLWRYSRHPNFFFECVHWLAYPFLAIGAPNGWLSLVGPVGIAFLLLKVSGVPTVEGGGSQRAGYDDYVKRTSRFIPLPPKRT